MVKFRNAEHQKLGKTFIPYCCRGKIKAKHIDRTRRVIPLNKKKTCKAFLTKRHGKSLFGIPRSDGQEDIINVIIRHELSLDRPVSASSDSRFRGLPNHLRPFGL
jgi:hypothetical protein